MSATVQAKGVGAGFGDRELFSGVDLVVAPGDVIGLVGPNGAGKSTLLQILGGRRPPDSGSVSRLARRTRSSATSRRRSSGSTGESVRAHLERRTGVAPAQEAMDAAADALGAGERGRRRRVLRGARDAGSRSAAPTSTRAWARWPTTSA